MIMMRSHPLLRLTLRRGYRPGVRQRASANAVKPTTFTRSNHVEGLGLTSNDTLPDVDDETLKAYYEHLSRHLLRLPVLCRIWPGIRA